LLTFAILWNLIFPRSGLGNVSPEMTSRSNINLSPLRKSSSMFSMAVPAFRRCELHHAVKVCKENEMCYINHNNIKANLNAYDMVLQNVGILQHYTVS
jgi:hypothetical protein